MSRTDTRVVMVADLDGLSAALAGRYRIERELGQGGMATVYLARDLKHERQVAIKVLRPDLAAVIGAERFLAEIRTTANLQHPHILPLFDSGQADTLLYYVMPYVEGETLREKLDREKQLPVEEAVRVTTDVAEALDHAHGRGVIHRDIKPANILLQDGRALVADFGVALAVRAAGGDRLTETGTSLGTPHYMSPEQASADPDITGRSDLYSLGAVLYEMLAGDPPHSGPNSQVVLTRILTEDPRPVSEVRRSVPAHVADVARRALEKLPADRFRTGAELARALADPGFRYGSPAPATTRKLGSSRWTHVAWALGGVAVGSVLTIAFRPENPGLDDSADVAGVVKRSTIDVAGTDRLDSGLLGGARGRVALSSDGRTLAYAAERDGVSHLFVRPLDQFEARQIQDTEGATTVFFSPDGARLGFFVEETLKTVAVTGGPVSTVHQLPSTQHGASWGTDDTILFARHESTVWRIGASGGTPQPVTSLEPGDVDHHNPTLLPGGDALLFNVQSTPRPSHVAVQVLSTGERRELAVGGQAWYLPGGYVVFARESGIWAVPFDIETLMTIGEPVRVLDDVLTGRFAPAADGSAVFVTDRATSAREIVWVDRSGQPSASLIEAGRFSQPDLSPDGSKLAVSTGDALWVIDLNRGGARSRLTQSPGGYQHPAWVPDGERVSFMGRTRTHYGDIFWAPADGAGEAELLLGRDGVQREGSWHPDGRVFAYVQLDPETRDDLWLLEMERSDAPTPLVRTPARERAPRFSPDGRWIAYVSNDSGRDEVFIQPYPGPGDRVTISTAGGAEPVWSGDGQQLFFRAGSQLLVSEIRVGEPPGIPQLLFDVPYELDVTPTGAHPNYDVSPDGERFVMIRRPPLGPTKLILIENWLEELRELAPR